MLKKKQALNEYKISSLVKEYLKKKKKKQTPTHAKTKLIHKNTWGGDFSAHPCHYRI